MFVCCTSERSSLLTPLSGVDITASTESTESQRPAAKNYTPLSHYMLVTIEIIQKHVTNSTNSKQHNHHKQWHRRLFTCLYVCHVITTNSKKLKILKLWWSIIAQCLCPKFNESSLTASKAVHMHTHSLTHTLSLLPTCTQQGNLRSILTSARKKTPSKNSVVGALMTEWQIKMESVAKNVSSLITLGISGLSTAVYLVFFLLRHFMNLSLGKLQKQINLCRFIIQHSGEIVRCWFSPNCCSSINLLLSSNFLTG
jgi:hypothetical protein